jgi:FkbM family methyltransferase
MKQFVKSMIKHLLPVHMQLPLEFRYHKFRGSLDKEMLGVEKFLSKRRRFIDVGANTGFYSYHFSRSFMNIEAFEPVPEASNMLKMQQISSVKIHDIALSNHNGTQNFFIPLENALPEPGLASLEKRDGVCEERIVPIKTLDEFGFDDIDLIKIDVEGHELKVLQGASATIEICKPVMIIEIEQRHIGYPIQEIFDFVIDKGYSGMFLSNSDWLSLDKFSCDIHQTPYLNNVYDSGYVNNFVFVPNSSS